MVNNSLSGKTKWTERKDENMIRSGREAQIIIAIDCMYLVILPGCFKIH